jgi:FAD/FMN-containing dehydrogenase
MFDAAIGGYGAVGVITEVELDLAENMRIERVVEAVPLARDAEHFKAKVLADPRAVLHNADLLPPAFDAPVSVTWLRAPDDKALTETARLVAQGRSYGLEQNVIWAATELPGGQALRRKLLHPLLMDKPVVKWLDHGASLDPPARRRRAPT